MNYLCAPSIKGLRLTDEGEQAYCDWLDAYGDRGCTCFISPPCSCCTHEGHPANAEETAEFWEPDAVDINVIAITKEMIER